MKKKSKLFPVGVLILLDLLMIGAVLCSFAYFHHIRTLWGTVERNDADRVRFTKPIGDNELEVPDTDGSENLPIVENGEYDYSGDFGKTLPEVFLTVGAEVISTDTTYQSQDINMTLTEVNRELYYNDKTYTVQYFVYDIYIRNIENLFTVAVDEREPMKDLMASAGELTDADGNLLYNGSALAAVNGDYWGNANHAQVSLRNGILLRESEYVSSDICVLYYDGTMETISPDEYDWSKIAEKVPYQIWEFGPGLLDQDGEALTEFSNDSYDGNVVDNRHPRCAIGYYEPGHYCFVVVDGRSDDSDGVRMFQLSEIFEELGCKAAYNLDGGDSCQAYFGEKVIRESASRGDDQRDLYDIIGIGEVIK